MKSHWKGILFDIKCIITSYLVNRKIIMLLVSFVCNAYRMMKRICLSSLFHYHQKISIA